MAEPGDQARLSVFRCLPDELRYVDDDDNPLDDSWEDPDEDGVEHWFQRDAYKWSIDPTFDGPRLILMLSEDDGSLLGAAGHEGCVEPVWGRFVKAVGISSLHHDRRYGRMLLLATLRDCAERAPGAVATWLVRRSNERSLRMCESIDGAWWVEEEGTEGQILRFKYDLPSSLPPVV